MFALSVRHCPIPFERNSNQPVPNQLLVWIRASPTRFNNATRTRIQIANIIKSSANHHRSHWNIKTLKSLTLQCLSHRFQGTAASDKWTTWARSRSQLSASEKQSHDKDEAVHTTTILVHWLYFRSRFREEGSCPYNNQQTQFRTTALQCVEWTKIMSLS